MSYLLGLWRCLACWLVIELHASTDPADQTYVTTCPACGRAGTYTAAPAGPAATERED